MAGHWQNLSELVCEPILNAETFLHHSKMVNVGVCEEAENRTFNFYGDHQMLFTHKMQIEITFSKSLKPPKIVCIES